MSDNRFKKRAESGKDDLVTFWSSGPGLITAAAIALGTCGYLIYNVVTGL